MSAPGRADLAHLNLPDGTTRPYRPKPADFRAVYLDMGWDGITEHYGTNWRVIRRWIEQEGREELIAARAAAVAEKRAERRAEKERGERRRRYVLGRTLRPVGRRGRLE
jgi:hypothetical protein